MYQRPAMDQLTDHIGRGFTADVFRVGEYVVKKYRQRPDFAEHAVLEGERRLKAAGIPVVPIIDHWVYDGRWYCVQPLVEAPDMLSWSDDQIRRGLELVEQAYEAGVSDIKPDNVGLLDGEMAILDTGELDPQEWEPGETSQRWRILLRQR